MLPTSSNGDCYSDSSQIRHTPFLIPSEVVLDIAQRFERVVSAALQVRQARQVLPHALRVRQQLLDLVYALLLTLHHCFTNHLKLKESKHFGR